MKALAHRALDEEAWFAERRKGVTASDMERIATPSGRRAVLAEKLTGERRNLARVPAIAWGKAREAAVMDWVKTHFDIHGNATLYSGDNPRHMATPDGLAFREGKVIAGAEVKCSGHAITPGEYQRQIQWQMHVFNLDQWLLVWEQHDGNHPDPKPLSEPDWTWIDRDQHIIDQLVREADALLADMDSTNPVDLEPLILEDSDEIAYYAGEVLAGRDVEKEGVGQKEAAWAKLNALLTDQPDGQWRSDIAQVTWSTTPGRPTRVVDRDAMRAKAPAIVQKYLDLEARFTRVVDGEPSRKLTITRKETS
ncbi:MAG: hypothetical protein IMZ55_17645 [Acidobacteria bacterium]|nr:hypothetical protein [Acidobacteriota bacterium]